MIDIHAIIAHAVGTLDAIPPSLSQYGSIALFALLAIGIIGLPIPDETLMISVGFLVAKGKFSLPGAIFASYAGSICGMSVSYMIGRTAGSYLIKKYGHWFGITVATTDKARRWFRRIEEWALFFGYFIPGVRHLTGYIAGTMGLHFKLFALFAYSGAIIWASFFLIIGYMLGC